MEHIRECRFRVLFTKVAIARRIYSEGANAAFTNNQAAPRSTGVVPTAEDVFRPL